MGANLDAIQAVRESAFQDMEWTEQASGVAATNGAPSSSSDGVPMEGSSAFSFQVVKESGTVALDIQVHGYANGAWGAIPDGEFTIDDKGLIDSTNLAGALERVYLEVSAYTSGTVTLNVGVSKP